MDTLSSSPRLSGSHSTRNKWLTVLVFATLIYNVLEGCSSFVSKTLREAEMFPGMSESIVELCHGSGFSDPNERKYLSSFFASLVWLISAPWNGAERQPGSIGVRREHGFREAQSIHLQLWTQSLLLVLFLKCHYQNGQKLLLSSFPVWIFFLHVVVENRNRKSQVYVSSERNPQWWVCTLALIGPIDLLGCIYNCLEIVNRCWSPALMVSHICFASTLPTKAAVIREHLAIFSYGSSRLGFSLRN